MIYLLSSAGLGVALGIFSIKYQKAFLLMFLPAVPVLVFVYRNIIAMLNRLPQEAQDSIILFPVAFIVARLVSWIVSKFIKPKAGETASERKKRILKEYGYKNGLPY